MSKMKNCMESNLRPTTKNWDKLGIGVTILCLLHCAALPLLVVAFPLLGCLHGDSSHLWLTLVAIPTAFLALFPAYRSHGRVLIPLSGFIGLNLLVGAELYGHFLGHGSETLLALTGAALLIGAHWVNLQLQKSRCC